MSVVEWKCVGVLIRPVVVHYGGVKIVLFDCGLITEVFQGLWEKNPEISEV